MFDLNEKRWLLALARQSIYHFLKSRQELMEKEDGFPPDFLEKRGTFVTLNIDKNLRGCIGNIEPLYPVYKGIMENAVNAAFRDPRFHQLIDEEFSKIDIEISILTNPKALEYKNVDDLLSKLVPDKDGVIIKKDEFSATFLPQVWEQIRRPEDFLSHLCAKAGLMASEWKDGGLAVETYGVESFDEKEIMNLAG